MDAATMALDIEFSVVDEPAAQGSKRYLGNGRVIEMAGVKLESWREAVKTACHLVLPEGYQPVDVPVIVYATFYLKRPQSQYVAQRRDRGLREDAPIFVVRTPDLDKLLRAVLDALTGAGVWVDDSRVVRLVASKRYCNPDAFPAPGARIRVAELKD
jgi:crossover junction endodeoxyribonuclease RusA